MSMAVPSQASVDSATTLRWARRILENAEALTVTQRQRIGVIRTTILDPLHLFATEHLTGIDAQLDSFERYSRVWNWAVSHPSDRSPNAIEERVFLDYVDSALFCPHDNKKMQQALAAAFQSARKQLRDLQILRWRAAVYMSLVFLPLASWLVFGWSAALCVFVGLACVHEKADALVQNRKYALLIEQVSRVADVGFLQSAFLAFCWVFNRMVVALKTVVEWEGWVWLQQQVDDLVQSASLWFERQLVAWEQQRQRGTAPTSH